MCKARRVKQNAITFIELLMVVIILGILIGVSMPSFRNTFADFKLNNFSRELQSYMNYLRDRSIVEGKVIYFNINNESKQYWAQIKDTQTKLKTYPIPQEVEIEIKKPDTDDTQIFFYPDGQIDKVSIRINQGNQNIILTTEGVFGKVKIKTEK